MLVREIMSAPVVSVPSSATLQGAVVTMLESGVGSVIVRTDDVPTGILTETDVLVAAARTERPLADVAVTDAMTADLVTGRADMTVREAVARMNRHAIKKLPIVEDFDVLGVLTMSDVVRHHTDLIKEAHRVEDRTRSRWDDD